MIAVDYFAGAGGWSTGAAMAGVRVAAAVNHWPRAVETHKANHPDTLHHCQDAALLDPAVLPDFDTLIASPACQGHSYARGKDQPKHDADRATAWCVVNCAEIRLPRLILVENVPQMTAWRLFPMWRGALEALGYSVTLNVLNASDFGVPQDRPRLFVVATRGRRAPVLSAPIPALGYRPPTARQVIDFEAGEWSPVAGHAPRTLARIANGRRDFGRRFLLPYYSTARTGRALDRPIGTLTTKDRYAVIDGDRMRMLTVDEVRQFMGFPEGYVLTGKRDEQIKQLGNAVVPAVARAVVEQVKRGRVARAA